MCPAVIWLSWILAVTLLGTKKIESQYLIASPPSPPKKPNEYMPWDFAYFKASTIFEEFPDVEIASNISPFFAKELLTNLVKEVNNKVKEREVDRANKSIVYLDDLISQTSMRDLNLLLNKLKEKNLKVLMLAEIDENFILDVVDPPFLPTEKSKPYRALISVFGTFFGFLIGLFILGIFQLMRYEIIFSLFPFKLRRSKLH